MIIAILGSNNYEILENKFQRKLIPKEIEDTFINKIIQNNHGQENRGDLRKINSSEI